MSEKKNSAEAVLGKEELKDVTGGSVYHGPRMDPKDVQGALNWICPKCHYRNPVPQECGCMKCGYVPRT